MKALFESQRALDIERKLFANERCLQLSQSENMKLRAKLDELKLKYEPEGMYDSYILSFKLQETLRNHIRFFFFLTTALCTSHYKLICGYVSQSNKTNLLL